MTRRIDHIERENVYPRWFVYLAELDEVHGFSQRPAADRFLRESNRIGSPPPVLFTANQWAGRNLAVERCRLNSDGQTGVDAHREQAETGRTLTSGARSTASDEGWGWTGAAGDRIAQLEEVLRSALPIVQYVSRGRGYVGVERYPDATARRVNAEMQDALDGVA